MQDKEAADFAATTTPATRAVKPSAMTESTVLTKTLSDESSNDNDAASLTSSQGRAPSIAASKDSHHLSGGLSSFLGRDFHHNHNRSSTGSAIGQMLAPAISVAGAHNPFSINALCEDGSRRKTHQYGKSDKDRNASSEAPTEEATNSHSEVRSIASDTTDRSKRSRPRKRDRIRTAFGRSLSPWRYHNEQGEGRRSSNHWNLSRQSRDSLDVQREKSKKEADAEHDTESDAESIKSGIVPRNSAFGNYSEDSESEDEMGRDVRSRVASNKSAPSSSARTTSDTTLELPAKDEVNLHASHDMEELDADHQEHTDAEQDSDDYIDFDEETLDNTLYNAGCIDLHDAWLKDDNNIHHSHEPTTAQAHYGPGDYDAAWQGAGPSGHDEGDEGLRAPNVVIGENHTVSPSDLTGEGVEILNINEGLANTHMSSRPTSARTDSNVSVTSLASKASSVSGTLPPDETSTSTSYKGSNAESTPSTSPSQRLTASRPVFEKNRCTITLVHGEYEKMAQESKQARRYIAASDGSEESAYAIEWTIGTVLRDGDEMLVVSVMETDTKLDAKDAKHEDKIARQEHQRIRQSMAVILARRAVAVLQRTRLAVRVSCQALHARNSRHMFIDMIDFFEPTMCIVGSRGLGSLKGVLLGSFSHYCVQKSPVPVMVARRRLKLPPLPKGKTDVVSNVRARHMRLDQALIEKDANVADEVPDEVAAKNEKDGDGEGQKDGDDEKKRATNNEDDAVDEKSGEKESVDAGGHADDRRSSSDARPSSDSQARHEEEEARREQEKEEESAIKRDALQATELQEKERDGNSKKHNKHKNQVVADDVKSESQAPSKKHSDKVAVDNVTNAEPEEVTSPTARGRKKFSVGMHDDDDEDNEEDPQRGRSRSRTSERT